MLANEGNPLQSRNRLARERLEKVEHARLRRRAFQGGLWFSSAVALSIGIDLIFGLGAALVILGLWGLVTAWLIGATR